MNYIFLNYTPSNEYWLNFNPNFTVYAILKCVPKAVRDSTLYVLILYAYMVHWYIYISVCMCYSRGVLQWLFVTCQIEYLTGGNLETKNF